MFQIHLYSLFNTLLIQVHDHKRSVFVGNLPFDVQDEDLYLHFMRCGEIEFVRVVRDKKTNIGKGFGYIQFKVLLPKCDLL